MPRSTRRPEPSSGPHHGAHSGSHPGPQPGLRLEQRILRTDSAGMPLEWTRFEEAVKLYYTGQVIYACGTTLHVARGGINAQTGRRSVIEVNSIIATAGRNRRANRAPPLNNPALFRRDHFMCMYCGETRPASGLSRDHILPLSRGGKDKWRNVVSACRFCNNIKAGRTPEEAGMELLAVPFVPTYAEYIYLQARNILADQMEFLRTHFPRSSPLRRRLRH